jgi:hypothetical protein
MWYKTTYNAVVTSKDDGFHKTTAAVQAAEITDDATDFLHFSDSISTTETMYGNYATIISWKHTSRWYQEVTNW